MWKICCGLWKPYEYLVVTKVPLLSNMQLFPPHTYSSTIEIKSLFVMLGNLHIINQSQNLLWSVKNFMIIWWRTPASIITFNHDEFIYRTQTPRLSMVQFSKISQLSLSAALITIKVSYLDDWLLSTVKTWNKRWLCLAKSLLNFSLYNTQVKIKIIVYAFKV